MPCIDKNYVGDVGKEILVNCGIDISGSSVYKLKIEKPDGTTDTWDAVLEGSNYMKYTTVLGDFDQKGKYYVYAFIMDAGFTGLGNKVFFFVEENPFVGE